MARLVQTVELAGVGLFTAATSVIRLEPARAEGIRINGMPATISSLATTLPGPLAALPGRNTSLARGTTVALTIEHLLSAMAALGVWDAEVSLDGPEVPIFDGSSAPLLHAITPAVRFDTGPAPLPLRLHESITVSDGKSGRITASPRARPGLSYGYLLDYTPHAGLGPQFSTWQGDPTAYAADIAPARTFCLATEARALRGAGLFAHLTPADMLVLDDATGSPIDNTLRFDNEPARHKLLDLIGDLALLGRPLHADVLAERSGHALTHELCRRILAQET